VERSQRPTQLAREFVAPLLSGQIPDFALGSEPGEDGLRRARSRLRFGTPPGPAQDDGQVPRRLGLELRPAMQLRPRDHVTKGPLGRRKISFGRQHRRRDSQILGFTDRIGLLTPQVPHLLQFAPRRRQFAADHADLRPPAKRQRPQRAIPGRFRLRDGPVRFRQRAVERALLAIGDPQIVVALRGARPQPRPFEGRDRDLPRPDRFRVPPPQVADDAQVVGAAAGRRQIPVPARGHHGLRKEVGRLVDPPAHQRDRAPRIEGVTLDRLLVPLARPLQRHIQPPLAFVMPPEPGLCRPVQQREARRIFELAPRPRGEVLDDLGVVPGRGELLGLLDYD
jgi:hypothetical protein